VKLFCASCQRLGPPGSWSVIDGVLRIACGACGVEAELLPAALAARAAQGAPAVPPAPRVVAAVQGTGGAAVPPAPRVVAAAQGTGVAAAAAPGVTPAEGLASLPLHEIDRVLAEFVDAPTPGPEALRAAGWDVGGVSLAARETHAALAVATGEETLEEDPWLPIGWAALQQNWNDPAAHQRLLAEAAARGDFAGLGMRYRDHLARHPDDAVALAAREELLKKATAQMFTLLPREEGGLHPARARLLRNLLLLVFLAGVIAFGGWVLMQMGGGR